MQIYTADSPILKQICDNIDIDDNKEIKKYLKLAQKAQEMMYDTIGIGIAAPQVGINKCFIVVDTEYDPDTGKNKNPIIMFNPSITFTSDETDVAEEGCLSVPGVHVAVERPISIELDYFAPEKKIIDHIEANGVFARCIQHEIDHLNGITLLETLKGMKKLQGIAYFNAAKRQGIKPGEPSIYLVK